MRLKFWGKRRGPPRIDLDSSDAQLCEVGSFIVAETVEFVLRQAAILNCPKSLVTLYVAVGAHAVAKDRGPKVYDLFLRMTDNLTNRCRAARTMLPADLGIDVRHVVAFDGVSIRPPQEGDRWMDTSTEPPTLRVYRNGEWTIDG